MFFHDVSILFPILEQTVVDLLLFLIILTLPILQDYIVESDNLVSLHDQIHDCDAILSQMETLLSGFQVF